MTVYINSTTNADTITTFTLIGGIVTSIITSIIITPITMTGSIIGVLSDNEFTSLHSCQWHLQDYCR